MIEVPIAVVITQWIVLFSLGVLVLVVYRQLAYLLQMSRAATADGGPELGTKAPAFDYVRLGEDTRHRFEPGRAPAVLLFTDPGCGACDQALAALNQARDSGRLNRLDGLRTLIVTGADPLAVIASDSLRESSFETALVEHAATHRDYHITVTPLLIGIDSDGHVRAKAAGVTEVTLKSFLRDFRNSVQTQRQGNSTQSSTSPSAPPRR